MTPEELAEKLDLTLEGRELVAGVEFAEYTDEDGKTRYHLIYPNGYVDTMSLVDVHKDGNYTKARTRKGDRECMVDDDGIHLHWD